MSSENPSASSAVVDVPVEKEQLPESKDERRFEVSTKKITTMAQFASWPKTSAYADVVYFIMAANTKIRGVSRATKRQVKPAAQTIVDFLIEARKWIADIPPITQAQRFGNKAFRTWLAQLQGESGALMRQLTGQEASAEEVKVYFDESFGNNTRIDYGTGHELNFVAWLAALTKLGVFTEEDYQVLILDVFNEYLVLMRALQSIYWLEPAGSKGVWGLDDYTFLSFLWGASQLDGQGELEPADIHSKEITAREAPNYLLMASVHFVHTMKKGVFAEHSPILNDLSAAPSWGKVGQGLVKLFDKEVLTKFPVIQHFFFGSLLSVEPCSPDHPFLNKARKRPAPPVAEA